MTHSITLLRKFLKNSKKLCGSVTPMTALILASVCFLNLVLVDFSRFNSSRVQLDKKVDMAIDSILAGYDTILEQKYGIFGVNLLHSLGFETELYEYVYPKETKGALNFWNYEVNASASLSGSLAEPNALKTQILDYMKYRAPANLLEYVLDKLGVVAAAESQTKAAAKIAYGNTLIKDADDALSRLELAVSGYFTGDSSCVNGYKVTYSTYNTILTAINNFKEGTLKKCQLLNALMDDCELLYKNLKVYRDFNSGAISIIYELEEIQSQIEATIAEAEQLISQAEGLDATNLSNMIASLRSRASTISNNKNKNILSANVTKFNEKMSKVSKAISVIQDLLHQDRVTNPYETLKELLNEGTSIYGINTNVTVSKITEAKGDVIENAESELEVKKDTTLFGNDDFAIPGDVFVTLPSSLKARSEGATSVLDFFGGIISLDALDSAINMLSYSKTLSEIGQDFMDGILIDQYVFSFMSDRVSAGTSKYFKAEVEYILCGNQKSNDNIRVVATKILLLRFALNFVHCFADTDKYNLARSLGQSIASATYGIGADVYAILIITAWAMGESFIDLANLVKGKSVPLVKKSEDWNLSISGLTKMIGSSDDNDKDSILDMTYSDYLLLLLLTADKETELYRIADVIEVNMSKYVGQRYTLSGVFTTVNASVSYTPNYYSSILYSSLGKGDYDIEINKSKSF